MSAAVLVLLLLLCHLLGTSTADGSSVPHRTSTASSGWQCSPPDLNRLALLPMGRQPRAPADLNTSPPDPTASATLLASRSQPTNAMLRVSDMNLAASSRCAVCSSCKSDSLPADGGCLSAFHAQVQVCVAQLQSSEYQLCREMISRNIIG